MAAVFVDLQQAYDHVWRTGLMYKNAKYWNSREHVPLVQSNSLKSDYRFIRSWGRIKILRLTSQTDGHFRKKLQRGLTYYKRLASTNWGTNKTKLRQLHT